MMLTTAALLLALTVPATVTSVYDGDTIKVQAHIWPGHTWTGSVRLLGVDSPEKRGKCPEEKAAALAAQKFVQRIVGDRVTLHNIKLGKVCRSCASRCPDSETGPIADGDARVRVWLVHGTWPARPSRTPDRGGTRAALRRWHTFRAGARNRRKHV